jgi:LPS export ABC transporter permease LptG
VRIVSRYLLAQFVGSTVVVFFGILALWLGADTLLNIDELAGDPRAVFLRLAVHGLELLPLAIPIAAVVGVVWSLTRAARHREITAIRCGGVPLRAVLLPIAFACALGAVALVWVEDRLLVPTRERAIAARELAESGGRGRPMRANGRYWYASGSSVFSAQAWVPERSTFQGVSIFELDERHAIRRRIDADEVRHVEGSTWEILDARVFDFASPEIAIRHEPSLRADLGIGQEQLSRSAAPLGALPLRALASEMSRETDVERRASYAVAFHARLAQPLSILVLVLFAIRFAIGDTERGDSLARALLWSLAVTAGFWVCWTLALIAGRSAAVAAPIPIWLVTTAFLAAGIARFRAIEE